MPDDDASAAATDTLAAALARHGVEVSGEAIAGLDRYCQQLWDWNTKINLTRHTDYEKFVARDVVDTQAFSRAIPPHARVLDVGSGGGVPGIVLAMLRPDLQVTLCESVGKKARVLQEIVTALGIDVPVRAERAEQILAGERFAVLTVRAVAPLAKLLQWFAPFWGSFERLLVVKGPAWVEERHAAREAGLMQGLQLRKLESWPLPGTESESVLLEVRPRGS